MASFNLELVAPSAYHINSRRGEKGEYASLSGHIIISADSSSLLPSTTSIYARLVQFVKSTSGKSCCTKTSPRFSFNKSRLFCPSFFSPSVNPPEGSLEEEQAVEISLMLCSLEGTKELPGKIVCKYSFSLDVPATIPTTTKTPLGSVTYEIIASFTAEGREPVTRSQPVKLRRQATSEDSHLIRTGLEIPLSKLIKKMSLIQKPNPTSEPTLSFTAILSPRWQILRSYRPTEDKHLVIRELRWYAEEVIKVMSQPLDGSTLRYKICKSEITKKLCEGTVKGYWGSDQNPYAKNGTIAQEDNIWSLPINFAFNYPKSAAVIDEVDLACYEFGAADDVCPPPYSHSDQGFHMEAKKAILVEHQLRFEVVTREDTFDSKTKKLVERKPPQTTVCPAFPFTVCEISE